METIILDCAAETSTNLMVTKMKKTASIDGMNLLGYTPWGIWRNEKIFCVDKQDDGSGDLHRSPKRSYYRFREIIEKNGF